MWPDSPARPYGDSTFGGRPKGPTLDELALVPPLDLPHRFDDIARLGREPTPWDVDTEVQVGGFRAAYPLVVPAMGSTPVAHSVGVPLARAAARAGIPLVIGENVATVHGYDERRGSMPSFKERASAYLDALAEGQGTGGLVIQQSVEDAMDELWWRVYADGDFAPHIQAGRLGFEIKVGQGAKPGLGGITLVTQDSGLGSEYALGPARPDGRRERFSAPGTFTPDIVRAQVRHIRNDFPGVRVWAKLPPSRDVVRFAQAAAEGGADAVTLDGAEAGTALAPQEFLDHVGLSTLSLVARIRRCVIGTDVILSGGLTGAADICKARALGATAAGLGRAPLEAVRQRAEATDDEREGDALAWFGDTADAVRKITYAMGSLSTSALTDACLATYDPRVAAILGVADALAVDEVAPAARTTGPPPSTRPRRSGAVM